MDKQDFVKNSLSPKSLSNDLATNDIKSELDNQLVETTITPNLNDAPHKQDRPHFSDNKKHQKKLEQKKLSQALRDNLLRRKNSNSSC